MQTGKGWPTRGCRHRIDNDVAAVANPMTGVAIYDTYDAHGWLEVGGTGVSAAIVAAVYALAGVPEAGTFPNAYPYGDPSGLKPVVTGANGRCNPLTYLCQGQHGYNGPGGCGVAIGVSAFHAHKPEAGQKMMAHPCGHVLL